MIAMPSCGEKNDFNEPDNPNSGTTTGNIPTEDGIVYTSGLVDLGLSVKWAARDLDKSTSDHFATSCTTVGSYFHGLAKDFSGNLPDGIAGTSYDNATNLLGSGWSTPTETQVKELIENCKISYTVFGDAIGLVITGKNGNAIFMNSSEPYWTSSVFQNIYLRTFYINSDSRTRWDYYNPNNNYKYIRPVHN